jgi:putative ABC transport system ATP-binding protein
MTALENVELPLVFKHVTKKRRRRMAREMLNNVGLGDRIKHKPKEMSGGQQQRVGIARAFVSNPEIVFADEPTGNLDSKTSKEVMDIIKNMALANNQTIVMVTHDKKLTRYADRIIHIFDGRIEEIVDLKQEETAEPEEFKLDMIGVMDQDAIPAGGPG